MLADPQFGFVGLALLPFIFFYISTKLSEIYKPLIVFFFSLGILSLFLAIWAVIPSLPARLQDAFTWFNYTIIVMWSLYLLFEMLKISFVWLIKLAENIKGVRRK